MVFAQPFRALGFLHSGAILVLLWAVMGRPLKLLSWAWTLWGLSCYSLANFVLLFFSRRAPQLSTTVLLVSLAVNTSVSVTAAVSSRSRRPAPAAVGRVHSAVWWASALAIITASVASALWYDASLPAPLGLGASEHVFSEARAMSYLKDIASFGHRHVASATVDRALDYVGEALGRMDAAARSARSRRSGEPAMEVWRGRHSVGQSLMGIEHVYTVDMPVMAVRLSDGTESTRNSTLILDAHIDSQFFTSGISDDAIWVATSLEIIRVILNEPVFPFKHGLIFLFSCEEEAMQGPRGFFRNHPWNTTVRAFANLEAGGAAINGAALLQSTSHWASRSFSKIHRPVAYALLNDFFQSGIVASATHFQIYQELGYQGVDLTYTSGGWWYHTDKDDVEHIAPGAMQHGGENLLELIRIMTESPEFENIPSAKGGIASGYGLTVVLSLSAQWTAFAFLLICLAAITCAVCRRDGPHMFRSYLRFVAAGVLLCALCLVCGVVTCCLVSQIACGLNGMAFYAHLELFFSLNAASALLGLLLPLRLFPAVAAAVVGPTILKRPSSLQMAIYCSSMILNSCILLFLMALGFGHALEVLLHLCFEVLSLCVLLAAGSLPCARGLRRLALTTVLPIVVTALPAVVWSVPAMQHLAKDFYPTLGRSLFKNPALSGAAFSSVLFVIPWMPLLAAYSNGGVPLERSKGSDRPETPSRAHLTGKVAALVAVVVVVLCLQLRYSAPFTADFPSRVSVYHEADLATNASRVVVLFPHSNSISPLKEHLLSRDPRWADCVGSTMEWKPWAALCVRSDAPPPLQAPRLWLRSTRTANGRYAVEGAALPARGTARLVLLLPHAPRDLTMNGAQLALRKSRDTDFAAVFSIAHGAEERNLTFSFTVGEENAGEELTLRAEALVVSRELQAAVDGLPRWATLWGKCNIPLPAAVYTRVGLTSSKQ
eukprot:m51a1_g9026 hypothetical protein (945) ;mRNA; r:210464-215397